MGVSENTGYLITVWGTILGPPIFGNSHIVFMWGLIQGFRVQGISVSHAASQYLCFSRCSQRPEPIVFGCLEMPFIGHPVDGQNPA